MPREFPRSARVAEQLHRVLNELLRDDIDDPRLHGASISHVDLSRDLGHARVYFSLLDPEADHEAPRQALEGAAGFLRRRLGRVLHIRHTPELTFVHDESGARGAHLSELIDRALAGDDD